MGQPGQPGTLRGSRGLDGVTDPGGRIQNIGSNGGRRELRDEDGGGKTRCKCKLTSRTDRGTDETILLCRAEGRTA